YEFGKQILSLFKIDYLSDYKDEYLKNLESLYQENIQLTKKIKSKVKKNK
ncbi:MAG: hypothetical protein QG635_1199, partial [Bacteroidota bacterium]|nr:hypothetical protein [Bacteroidota bacterium]